MTKQVLVSKDSLNRLVLTNDKAVYRAILALFARQTASEKASETTTEHNNRGFSGTDAEFYSSLAKSINRYGSLSPKQLAAVRRLNSKGYTRLSCYHRQLNEEALAKQQERIAA